MRNHRRRPRAPDLTSLLDVLFILVFAALVSRAAAKDTPDALARAGAPRSAPPVARAAAPTPLAGLRARALVDLGAQLAAREPVVVRVSAHGIVDALETEGRRIPLEIPLLEHSPDPDVGVSYLGERSAQLRLCSIAALQLRLDDLSRHLVIVAPATTLADLPHALHDGLHRDVIRCSDEQHGIATIVPPGPGGTP